MKVFKFGGASVKDASGVQNLAAIIKQQSEKLFIVVSAIGKTTNAMEGVLDSYMRFDVEESLGRFGAVRENHDRLLQDLFGSADISSVKVLYAQVEDYLRADGRRDDYDLAYDALVSYGELLSTTIISEYLNHDGLSSQWLDMRDCIVTDARHREADVNMALSTERLISKLSQEHSIYVGQGFIGATKAGVPTTLGREGSDYSAAVVGVILGAESVTIWKDVPGVMNADPRRFVDAVHIPQLSYQDAVELAYSGASVIHPKTIKPLHNSKIPLYVRPFMSPKDAGSVISAGASRISIPVYIVKSKQVLVTIKPKDFSFVIEERLSDIFRIFNLYRIKINLIQSSAIKLSVSIDDSRYLERLCDDLGADFKVWYNKNLELLTVRGFDNSASCLENIGRCGEVLLEQSTRSTRRILYR
ncbi:MAG: aspartate kinase [Rikenellaceae bacterium]